jgi:hypothetical protein
LLKESVRTEHVPLVVVVGGCRGGQPREKGAEKTSGKAAYALPALRFSWSTFLTILRSSMMKARRMRVRVQPAQREPPYARETVRSRFGIDLYWNGRRRGSCEDRNGGQCE